MGFHKALNVPERLLEKPQKCIYLGLDYKSQELVLTGKEA